MVCVMPWESVALRQISNRLFPAMAENCSAGGATNEVAPFPATGSSTGCTWLMWNSHTCQVSALDARAVPEPSVAEPFGVYVLPTLKASVAVGAVIFGVGMPKSVRTWPLAAVEVPPWSLVTVRVGLKLPLVV